MDFTGSHLATCYQGTCHNEGLWAEKFSRLVQLPNASGRLNHAAAAYCLCRVWWNLATRNIKIIDLAGCAFSPMLDRLLQVAISEYHPVTCFQFVAPVPTPEAHHLRMCTCDGPRELQPFDARLGDVAFPWRIIRLRQVSRGCLAFFARKQGCNPRSLTWFTWKSALGKGDSCWKPLFSGSMLNFWGVKKWLVMFLLMHLIPPFCSHRRFFLMDTSRRRPSNTLDADVTPWLIFPLDLKIQNNGCFFFGGEDDQTSTMTKKPVETHAVTCQWSA